MEMVREMGGWVSDVLELPGFFISVRMEGWVEVIDERDGVEVMLLGVDLQGCCSWIIHPSIHPSINE